MLPLNADLIRSREKSTCSGGYISTEQHGDLQIPANDMENYSLYYQCINFFIR